MHLFPRSTSILETIIMKCPLIHNIVFTYTAQTSIYLTVILCEWGFCLCLYLCILCMQFLQMPEEGSRPLGT